MQNQCFTSEHNSPKISINFNSLGIDTNQFLSPKKHGFYTFGEEMNEKSPIKLVVRNDSRKTILPTREEAMQKYMESKRLWERLQQR